MNDKSYKTKTFLVNDENFISRSIQGDDAMREVRRIIYDLKGEFKITIEKIDGSSNG